MPNIIIVFLFIFITPHVGVSQYYDDMRYDAILPNYEYKKLNNQVLLFLNKQDTTNNLKKHIKPVYSIFPLIVVENHYSCDTRLIYYDILLYAKKTLQNKNIWFLFLFHKEKRDLVWEMGISSSDTIYSDTNYKSRDNYMQTYKTPPSNNQIIDFLTKQTDSIETNLLSNCRFSWKNIIHNSKKSMGTILSFDDKFVPFQNTYLDTLN